MYKKYPDRPLEFEVQTNKAPTFVIEAEKITTKLNVRAKVVVDNVDGSKVPVFYIDLVSLLENVTIFCSLMCDGANLCSKNNVDIPFGITRFNLSI